MKYLVELVELVTSGDVKKVDFFHESHNEQDLEYLLYNGIRTGKYTTDDEAALDIYKSVPSDKKYLMLKTRVRNKLLISVFYLDEKKFFSDDPYARKMYKTSVEAFCANALSITGLRNCALKVAKTTLSDALELNLHKISIDCLGIICEECIINGNEKDYQHYRQLLKQENELLRLECEAELHHNDVIAKFGNKVFDSDKVLIYAKEKLEKVKLLLRQYKSNSRKDSESAPLIELYLYSIKVIIRQLERKHKAVLTICNNAETYFQDQIQYKNNRVYSRIVIAKAAGLIYMRQFDEAERHIHKYLQSFIEGSMEWFNLNEYHFLLSMQRLDCRNALISFSEVTSHSFFRFLPDHHIERWKIYRAYLSFMLLNTDYNWNDDELCRLHAKYKLFNHYKFLNEVPIASKDKKGLNIAIQLAQVLHLFEAGGYETVIDKTESLRLYRDRYLKDKNLSRSRNFFSMIICMIRKDFSYQDTIDAAHKYYLPLVNIKQKTIRNFEHIEILPFEYLWEKILAKLKERVKQLAFIAKQEKSDEIELDCSILLVEDDNVSQQLGILMLEKIGCKVDIAHNGLEALEKFNQNEYDLVLMDIQMPVMDGFTAVDEMRKISKKVPPVIGISVNPMEHDMSKYRSLGLDDYLDKPVKFKDLYNRVLKWTS